MLDRHGRLSENLYEFKQMHQGEKESVCVSFLLSYSVQVLNVQELPLLLPPFQIELKKPCVVVGGGWVACCENMRKL